MMDGSTPPAVPAEVLPPTVNLRLLEISSPAS